MVLLQVRALDKLSESPLRTCQEWGLDGSSVLSELDNCEFGLLFVLSTPPRSLSNKPLPRQLRWIARSCDLEGDHLWRQDLVLEQLRDINSRAVSKAYRGFNDAHQMKVWATETLPRDLAELEQVGFVLHCSCSSPTCKRRQCPNSWTF